MDLTCVTVDSQDPAELARFWSAALRWDDPVVAAGGASATCFDPVGGPYLEFVRVSEPKQSKNRLHLGCQVHSLDEFDAEFDRLVALGASLEWREVFGPAVDPHYRNWVLSDPEGNEFCLGGGQWPAGEDTPAEVPIERP